MAVVCWIIKEEKLTEIITLDSGGQAMDEKHLMIDGYPRTLVLKTGEEIVLKVLDKGDKAALLAFFQGLPAKDKLFLKEDVTKPEVIQRWIDGMNFAIILPILAWYDNKVVGDATLHMDKLGWSQHVGEIRVVVASDFQHKGLGKALVKNLVAHAIDFGLDKISAMVMGNQHSARKAFERLGFEKEAVLKGHVRDIQGNKQDLIILSNDVSYIWHKMEELVSDFDPRRFN